MKKRRKVDGNRMRQMEDGSTIMTTEDLPQARFSELTKKIICLIVKDIWSPGGKIWMAGIMQTHLEYCLKVGRWLIISGIFLIMIIK